jgi:hypothetical protein
MELLTYQAKAKFNEENFQIMNLIQTQPSFKVIFFQIDKEFKRGKVQKFEGVTRSIEKVLERSENAKEDMQRNSESQTEQLKQLQLKTLDMIDDL